MQQKPRLNVSGYRGIWGQDLNEQIAFEYARSFAKMIKKTTKDAPKILVGRDGRETGPFILNSFEKAFKLEGIEMIYAGIIPTPSVLLLTRKLVLDGGVIITASHNPKEYNGLKFVNRKGLFVTETESTEIQNTKDNLTDEEKKIPSGNLADSLLTADNVEFRRIHINEVLKNIDVEKIKAKKFKVAIDPVNSSACLIDYDLLLELGCEIFMINSEPNGKYTRGLEPIAVNLSDIARETAERHADIGFAQDPDADRLVVINEKGEILSEEYTLALALKNVLSREENKNTNKDVVVNMSTFNVSADVTEEYGANVHRTKIGEANVVTKMTEINALIGGEGSGGVIFPKINSARDSLVGIGLILELLARENKTISEIADNLPKYFIQKDKITFNGDLPTLYEKLKKEFFNAKINTLDGVRFDWLDKSWIHIRPSNTEPIVRIFGEAKTENRIKALFEQVRLTLNSQ